jgi:histidinol-phosphate aminotransferase
MHELDKLRPPYNVGSLTQAIAPILLAETALLATQAKAIVDERERLHAALAALPGVRAFPSRANFVLARFADANATFEQLRRAGILVKNMHGAHPALAQCLRITVGTPDDNDRVLAALGPRP